MQDKQNVSVTRSNTSFALDMDEERRRKDDLILKYGQWHWELNRRSYVSIVSFIFCIICLPGEEAIH